MQKKIRIGTRSSKLALWQARTVAIQLEELGHDVEVVKIDSQEDLDLENSSYETEINGAFTRTLDKALLNDSIDIAVHSMKDVPIVLPKKIVQAAVLKRAGSLDVLVYNGSEESAIQK